jgi:hypothetical protein
LLPDRVDAFCIGLPFSLVLYLLRSDWLSFILFHTAIVSKVHGELSSGKHENKESALAGVAMVELKLIRPSLEEIRSAPATCKGRPPLEGQMTERR